MKTITLNVTKRHVQMADEWRANDGSVGVLPQHCPVANAACDRFKCDEFDVWAGVDNLDVGFNSFAISNDLLAQMRLWDSRKGFKPGKYKLKQIK